MLEIIFIIYLSRLIGKKAIEKGRKEGSYKFMFVSFWILGEITGAIVGAGLTEGFVIYLFAIIGASFGALIAFAIVNNLKESSNPKIVAERNLKTIEGDIPNLEEKDRNVTLIVKWSGCFILLDHLIYIIIDEAIVASGSFVEGFDATLSIEEGNHKIFVSNFKPKSRASDILNVDFEKGKSYKLEFEFGRMWAKFKVICTLIDL